MEELTFGWGGGIKIWWEGGLLGGSSQMEGEEWANVQLFNLVPGYVLIPLANHNLAIFSVPQGTEELNKLPQADNNSNVLLMFDNNSYIDFRTACKHVLIPSYFIQVI